MLKESSSSFDSMEWVKPTPQQMRILLVEDTPANQMLARAVLEHRGHLVQVANNGREALEYIREQDFDLVLMDVQMPTMDGLTAAQLIRQLPSASQSEIPIVAMTGNTRRQDRRQCLQAGMDACITKPMDAAHLVEVVETIERRTSGMLSSEAGISPANPPSDKCEAVNIESARARMGGDEALVAELAQFFLNDVGQFLAEIERSLHNGGGKAVERSAHNLKSLAANFDGETMIVAAIKMEQAARQNDVEQVRKLFPELDRAARQVSKALQHYLQASAAGNLDCGV